MQGLNPFQKSTDIHDLMRSVIEFRAQNPKPGSALMVELVEHMVNVFDNIDGVNFSSDDNQKGTQIKVLYLLRFIKKILAKRDWDEMSRQTLLYPAQAQ